MKLNTLISLIGATLMIQGGSAETANKTASTLYVYESQRAIQCEPKGSSLEGSATKLQDKGISIIESSCGIKTGLMVTTVCGAPTLGIFLHKINRIDLATAQAAGFKNAKHLIDVNNGLGYQPRPCQR